MSRGVYEEDRARQLTMLLRVVLGIVAIILGWAGLILLGHGSVGTAVRVLVLPGLLLGLFAAGSLRALAVGSPTARKLVPATGVITVLIAVLLSQTTAGLLVAVVGVPLLLIAVLPGRDPDAGPSR